MSATPTGLDRFDLDSLRPRRETLLYGALLVNTELLVLAGYAVLGPSELVGPLAVRYWLYPFVWINASLWAVARTDVAPSPDRHRLLAGALAVAYFALLAYVGGLVGPGHSQPTGVGLSLFTVPPGWAPTLVYSGTLVQFVLIPFKVVGYLTLAYLVYATTLDAAGAAVSGVLGLLSCVSCTWPVLASVVTGIAGSTAGVAGTVYAQSYGLSTAVFVLTVLLLVYRPFAR